MQFASDDAVMLRALELAARGFGSVEPNPQVGAVIVTPDRRLIAEGWHVRPGGPHAEIHAIHAASGQTRGADIFITLEPCSHHGRTPPCVDALLAAGFRRVVVGCVDPAPHASGRGLQILRQAGLHVDIGVCQTAAEMLIAPFARQILRRLPWVHAKWAMSLDGRIATDSGHSQWISAAESRQAVHQLRGRVEAILTGAGTVRVDNPQLTARPPGPRTPVRVVFDSAGQSLSARSQLAQTINDAPLLVCVSERCSSSDQMRLRELGAEVFMGSGAGAINPREVLEELGRRGMTHVLLEAGPRLLGCFFDQRLVDEVHIFVAPKFLGGQAAASAVAGRGVSQVPAMAQLQAIRVRQIGPDVLIEGKIDRNTDPAGLDVD